MIALPLRRPRHVARIAVATLLAALAWQVIALARPTRLPGTDLELAPAPAFALTDYRGVAFDLSSFRGRPVVLSFVYSNCPDVCRLTVAGLKQAAATLGPQADRVAFVAVTTDPGGDDATSVRRFLARQGMADRLVYLTGPAEALPDVWQRYYLYVDSGRLDAHTDAVYLLDKQGRQRALLHSDFDPDELAEALRGLEAEWSLPW